METHARYGRATKFSCKDPNFKKNMPERHGRRARPRHAAAPFVFGYSLGKLGDDDAIDAWPGPWDSHHKLEHRIDHALTRPPEPAGGSGVSVGGHAGPSRLRVVAPPELAAWHRSDPARPGLNMGDSSADRDLALALQVGGRGTAFPCAPAAKSAKD